MFWSDVFGAGIGGIIICKGVVRRLEMRLRLMNSSWKSLQNRYLRNLIYANTTTAARNLRRGPAIGRTHADIAKY